MTTNFCRSQKSVYKLTSKERQVCFPLAWNKFEFEYLKPQDKHEEYCT